LAIKSILKYPILSHEFARGNVHINGIESFWGYAKIRLVKFKGMNKNMFELHLKECEFRFNNRKQNQNLYKKVLLEIFRRELLIGCHDSCF
jgi:transposase